MRGKDDKTRLSYWFPIIRDAGLPVPKTEIISLTEAESTAVAMAFFGEGPRDEVDRLRDNVGRAADKLGGTPFFLRTDFTSAKHDWRNTCCVTEMTKIPRHLFAIWEYSECADFVGLPYDVWVVREMLNTVPLFHAFAGMPITREFRYFVRDGKIDSSQPYWPPSSILRPDRDDWRGWLFAASLTNESERQELEGLAIKAGEALGGYWSVDMLQTADGGWVVTDLAEGACSFKWSPESEKALCNSLTEDEVNGD